MEKLPRRKSEIIALFSQYQNQIQNKKEGVKIAKRKFECTCCICGNKFIRARGSSYFCDSELCQKINKSYKDYKYRNGEKGRVTIYKNRHTEKTRARRKAYEQTEEYKCSKSIRAKRYREENEHTRDLDHARKLRYYYRKYSALKSIRIEGADAISFEDWKKLYSAETCYYCGKAISGRNKTVDHKTPISKGGTNKLDNLCMCCQSCNSKKGNKTEADFKGMAI